jgi:hypothetical protein
MLPSYFVKVGISCDFGDHNTLPLPHTRNYSQFRLRPGPTPPDQLVLLPEAAFPDRAKFWTARDAFGRMKGGYSGALDDPSVGMMGFT